MAEETRWEVHGTRSVVALSGADAENFLTGLITYRLPNPGHAVFAGLLTPQGKILFEFFVFRAPDGDDGGRGTYFLDVAGDQLDALIKRLMFYRLRAQVTITDVSEQWRVATNTGGGASLDQEGAITSADPRHADMGLRALLPAGSDMDVAASVANYERRRVALGVPEAGCDYTVGDAFPHEADWDLINGIDFKKGCYVGQEVVSRMQHRGTARKRCVPVSLASSGGQSVEPGCDVRAGTSTIGALGSVVGDTAIALIRLDRFHRATGEGGPVTAGSAEVTLRPVPWIAAAMAPPGSAPDELPVVEAEKEENK